MASIANDPNGRKRILFTDGDGRRRTIRLGKASVKAAESFRLRVEALIAARELRQPPDADLAAWLGGLPERVYDRLARVGLAPPRERARAITLGELIERFVASAAVKASTRAAYKQTTDSLRAYFGDDRPIDSITPADADGWKKAIADSGLAPATVAKRVHVAKGIFNKACCGNCCPRAPWRTCGPVRRPTPSEATTCPWRPSGPSWTPAPTRAGGPSSPCAGWRGCAALPNWCRCGGPT